MKELNDILTLEDIKMLVDKFYDSVRMDELLAPVFEDRIKDNWQEHLEKMYAFWQTVLFHVTAYSGSPFPPHARLPVTHEHFQRWLYLFSTTVDSLFSGKNADNAKRRANSIAEIFENKISFLRGAGKNA